jgi:hypothetical protein
MVQVFGDFFEELTNNMEFLIIGFSPSSLPLKQRWRNNGLSADFIADYLQTFFVGMLENGDDDTAPIPAKSKNAVKYIANELLENAMKFSDEQADYSTRIAFHLLQDKLVFYVVNSISLENMNKFQLFIEKLHQNDPHELYLRQMELNALDETDNYSGLGFLSMICDYSAKIGWRFETLSTHPPVTTVTTMVSLTV